MKHHVCFVIKESQLCRASSPWDQQQGGGDLGKGLLNGKGGGGFFPFPNLKYSVDADLLLVAHWGVLVGRNWGVHIPEML